MMSVLRYSLLLQTGKSLCTKSSRRFGGGKKSAVSELAELENEGKALSVRPEPLRKYPVKPPFVKNMFQGKFDKELLAYPEFLGEKRLKALDRNAEIVRKLFEEEVYSGEIDKTRSIPDDVLKKLSNLNLFGLSAPKTLGGLEFSNTERARIFEIISQDSSIAAFLFNHESLGYKLIIKYGDDFQQDTYLKHLIKGNMFCTTCFGESEAGSDASYFQTHVCRLGTDWMLYGKKAWVMSADKADLFIVFAKVRRVADSTEKNIYYTIDNEAIYLPEEIGIFLVEKGPKVKVGPRIESFGLHGVSFNEVFFDDVIVPDSHVLANFKKGYHIVREYMIEDRHLLACLPLAILKNVQEDIIDYSIRRKLHGSSLYNYGMIQNKISKVVVAAYAIESMLYFTTGLMDIYENQDVEVESAIVKIFSSEMGFEVLNEAMSVMGGNAFLESSPFYRYLKDLRFLTIMDSSNDLYKCLISLNGLQYISNDFADQIVKERNPLFYPLHTLKCFMNYRLAKTELDKPVLDILLKEDLHPSLQYVADQIEYCVIRFEHAVNNTLARTGKSTVNDQYILKRLADCIISIYAMVAVISRASRSYCIGNKNSDEELIIAETFVRDQVDKFKYDVEGIIHGEYYSTDGNSKVLADKSVKSLGYFLEEPLKLNY